MVCWSPISDIELMNTLKDRMKLTSRHMADCW